MMKDGTKSTDHEAPVKSGKKKASGDAKPSGKKSESTIKAGKKKEASAKKGATAAKSKKSDDDLDIESEEGSHASEALEASD